MSTDILQN